MNAVVLSPLAVVAADPDLAELLAVAAALPPCRADCGRLAERQRGGLCRRCSRDPAVRPGSPHRSTPAAAPAWAAGAIASPTRRRRPGPARPRKSPSWKSGRPRASRSWHPDDAR